LFVILIFYLNIILIFFHKTYVFYLQIIHIKILKFFNNKNKFKLNIEPVLLTKFYKY